MNPVTPVDTMPEFEGLNIRSSALAIEAKAHLAKGESFDAAVAWVKAGRSFGELGMELLQAGYVREGAEDLLNAVHCYLEAGDHRPAERELERFTALPQLRELVERDRLVGEEHGRLAKWCGQRRRELDRARGELREQMGDPGAAHRLSERWLANVLEAMPGVPDFHWFAARKAAHARRYRQADEHLGWCVRVSPQNKNYWIERICVLVTAKRYADAVDAGNEAIAVHDGSAALRWFVGWAILKQVIEGRGARVKLREAREHLERALGLGQLNEEHKVGVICLLSVCLRRLGDADAAGKLLLEAARDYPVVAGNLAWRMLRERGAGIEREVLAEPMMRGHAA
jgi:tetratricopeptide (TPR) repeat protein